MKVIIAGSRHMPFKLFHLIPAAVEKSGFAVTEVVCGMAAGADTLGAKWAWQQKIPIAKFPADWNANGKAAGPIRNKQMAMYADALIVFIWPDSRGSRNMLETMERLRKPTFAVFEGRIEEAF
jgi:hypothetical protein